MNKKINLKKEIKILAIGNSFSDNAFRYLYPILKSFGVKKVILGNLYIGGCSIERHYQNIVNYIPDYIYRKNTMGIDISTDNFSIVDGLKDEQWDYITMQQASHDSGISDTYSLLLPLKEKVEQVINNQKTKFAWHMTWAYQQNTKHPGFANYQNNQLTMYNSIINCVREKVLSTKQFDFLIPAGTAIQNARTSYLGDSLTCDDGFHLEPLGEFIAGLMYVVSLTGWDVEEMDVDLLPLWFKPYIEVVREAVKKAYTNPFKITSSKYHQNPLQKYLNLETTEMSFYPNISYQEQLEWSKLDLYLPKSDYNKVVIHFHGGGLVEGKKDDYPICTIGQMLVKEQIAFCSVDYPLYPNTTFPDFLYSAAQAIKFTIDFFQKKHKKCEIYLSGQSAGAYILMMLLFNPEYLQKVGLTEHNINGWIIESGQPTTHFKLLAEDGLDSNLVRIDEKAPIYYVNRDIHFNNVLLIAYSHDIPGRLAQNELLYQTIKNFNPNLKISKKVLWGNHCQNSSNNYRNINSYALLLIDYLHKIQ